MAKLIDRIGKWVGILGWVLFGLGLMLLLSDWAIGQTQIPADRIKATTTATVIIGGPGSVVYAEICELPASQCPAGSLYVDRSGKVPTLRAVVPASNAKIPLAKIQTQWTTEDRIVSVRLTEAAAIPETLLVTVNGIVMTDRDAPTGASADYDLTFEAGFPLVTMRHVVPSGSVVQIRYFYTPIG